MAPHLPHLFLESTHLVLHLFHRLRVGRGLLLESAKPPVHVLDRALELDDVTLLLNELLLAYLAEGGELGVEGFRHCF